MGYGRLGPEGSGHLPTQPEPKRPSNKKQLCLCAVVGVALLLAATVSATLFVTLRASGQNAAPWAPRPSRAISRTCRKTRYPDLCLSSLLDFPGSLTASEQDLSHISINLTLQRFNRAMYASSAIPATQMTPRARSAYSACMELLDDSVDALSRSLSGLAAAGGQYSEDDVLTWLSAAMTNHETCLEGLDEVESGAEMKEEVSRALKDLSELVSNSLAIVAGGSPVVNRRRRMLAVAEHEFPEWVGQRERELLQAPPSQIQADIVVAKDGSGSCRTIAEAIKKAPQHSGRRIIIYVKAGRYEEDNLKVGRKQTNLMFIGDGKGRTVISGGKSVSSDLTTFHTAAFAANGAGFIARDMTFENYAGPAKHQAVALRVGADHGVVYRCSISGFQDTLYVHSNRQFFRDCDIYGTVDFIFGNAAVVLQNCNMYARKPLPGQKITVTAQNRKDPNQNTGISIHKSRILATPDLEASKGSFPTYLGRPWKLYSRVVYMLSFMGDHINPRGWLEWNGAFALDTLYYGEYMNNGPGASTAQRVKWPGYRVITSTVEANRFTVAQFIAGPSWLPSTGVAFLSGLSE